MAAQQVVTPRLYVACLASYNAGHLHGVWLDVDDTEMMQEGIKDMLSESTVSPAQDWAIHDYEGFGSIELSEYASLDRVAEIADLIREHGEMASEVVSHFSGDVDDTRKALEEGYIGEYDSLEDFAERFTEETGQLSNIPESLRYYIDYKAMGRDMEINGDVFTIRANGQCHVFWNH